MNSFYVLKLSRFISLQKTLLCTYIISLENVLESREQNAELALICFGNNYMKLSTEKCHLVVIGNKHENVCAKTEKIWEKI